MKIIWKLGKGNRWLIGIGLFLLVIYTVIRLLLTFYVDDIVKDMTLRAIDRASKGRYHAVVSSIHYDLPTRSITFRNLQILPDTAHISRARQNGDSIGEVFRIDIPELHIQTVHLLKAWRKQAIQADALVLDNMHISIERNNRWKPYQNLDSMEGFDLSKIVPKPYRVIRFQHLLVNDASINMYDAQGNQSSPLLINHVFSTITDLEIDKKAAAQHKRLYYAHSFAIEVRDYEKALPDSVHRLRIDTIHFENNNLLVRNISIYTDPLRHKRSSRQQALNRIFIPAVRMDSLDVFKALKEDDIVIQSIRVDNPSAVLNRPDKHKNKPVKLFDPLYYLPKTYRSLTIGSLNIRQGKLSFYPSNNPSSPSMVLSPLMVRVTHFHVDTTTSAADKRLLFSDDVQLWVPHFSRLVNNGLSRLQVGSIYLSSASRKIVFQNIRLGQLLGKEALGNHVGHSIDWISLYSGRIELSGLNVHTLISKQQFIASSCTVNDFNLYDFRDKRIPDPPFRRKPLPSELIRDIDYLIDVNTVKIYNGRITYEEFDPKAKKAGIIHINDLSATVNNLNNSGAPGTMTVVMNGKIENQGGIMLKLSIPLASQTYNYHVSGLVHDLPLPSLNDMAQPAMGISLSSGYVKRMTFDFNATEDTAFGVMQFAYKNLQIQITNQRTGEQSGLKEELGSLIVNNLIIQTDNPKNGSPLRVGRIYYARNKNKSFINYTWNSILSGILSSVGVANMKNKHDERVKQKSLKQEIRDDLKLKRQQKREQRRQRRQQRHNKNTQGADSTL